LAFHIIEFKKKSFYSKNYFVHRIYKLIAKKIEKIEKIFKMNKINKNWIEINHIKIRL